MLIKGFMGRDDPGAIGAGRYWVDSSPGSGRFVARRRNALNTAWEDAESETQVSPFNANTIIEFTETGGVRVVVNGNEAVRYEP